MSAIVHTVTIRTSSGKTLTGGAGWAALESAVKRGQKVKAKK